MKFVKTASTICLIVSVSACAPTYQSAPVIVDAAIRSEIDQQIAQSGAEAASALRQIAAIQRVRTPAPSPAISDNELPADLRVKSTFEWSGPAPALVRDLAGRIGYKFRETGSPPAVPAMVNISLRETSVGQALADVGLQVQRVATVVVDPSARIVEYRNEAAPAPVNVIGTTTTHTPRARPHRSSAHRVHHVPGK